MQRNANWMEKILKLKDQTAVIAVGAGHLSNDHGLLNQLQQAGIYVGAGRVLGFQTKGRSVVAGG